MQVAKKAKNPVKSMDARVVELADTLDLGSSGATCRGSNPLSRTTKIV